MSAFLNRSSAVWAFLGNSAPPMLAPALMVFAFVCLSPWPICRVRPLRLPAVPGLLVTFTVAAAVGSLALVVGYTSPAHVGDGG